MKPIAATNKDTWTPQVWRGNPSLNLVCSCKLFQFGNMVIPVWIFGGTKEYPNFNFCVSAGRNSDLSYTGSCGEAYEIHKAQEFVDHLAAINKLIK